LYRFWCRFRGFRFPRGGYAADSKGAPFFGEGKPRPAVAE
jgi:hypothetical protein